MNTFYGKIRRVFLVTLIAALATGCFKSEEPPETQLTGSVGDGPVIGAMVRVFDNSGAEVASVSSNSTASYSIVVDAESSAFPLTIEASGGIDIVTSMPLDFTMKSVALEPSAVLTANINPFSALIVETALRSPGGLNAENLAAAIDSVTNHLNFGLDLALLADPVCDSVTAENIATTVKASEALGETIRRVSNALASSGLTVSPDEIVAALAADMVDGVLDGRGTNGVNARIAAVTNAVAAQVTVETLTNDLLVLGNRAEPLMDNAILVTMPGAPASAATGNVRVSAPLRAQALRTLGAASAFSPSAELDDLISAVTQLNAGATTQQARNTLPAQAPSSLSSLANQVAQGTTSDFEQLNGYVRSGSTPGPSENSAPEIFGTPVTTVDAGTSYYFRPAVNDVDGDILSFSVSTRPAWATFNSTNGALSGTPGADAVGPTPLMVITVSDGQASASLAPFSINVLAAPVENSSPTISGTPATSITAGEAYVFQPQAQDADNDALVYSISNKPNWATFSTSNGQLSGTPGESDIRVWANIVISVSDGQISVSLPAFDIEVLGTEPDLSATQVVQQQNNTGTLQEVTLASTSTYLNGQTVSGLLRVQSQVSGAGLYCCQRYKFNADGSIFADVPHNSAWTSRPLTVGSVHEFDTTTLPDGDYEMYIDVDDGTEAYIVFTIRNGDAPPPPPPPPPPPENGAPSISGSPASNVLAGEAYAFQPQASDPDGDSLVFSISNKPLWASFSTTTGRLSGTPSASHVGVSGGITITVSDGQLSNSLGPFSITVTEPEPNNRAPNISGSPTDSVLADTPYSFLPVASDPDGDALQFTVENLPGWATFSSVTGELAGVPTSADVGTYYDIVVSVTDGTLSSSLPPFSIDVTDLATGYALLSWTPPTERVDGTPLDQLAGYKVYHGTAPEALVLVSAIPDPLTVDYFFDNLQSGTHYFAVQAYDESGLDSALSNIASKTIN